MSLINVQQTERWASALGGAALIVAAARRLADERPGQAAFLSAVGAGLMWRGGTGHSSLYATTGINAAERGDDARAHLSGARGTIVEEAVSIARSPNDLYREWRQLERITRFIPSVVSVQVLDARRSHWIAKGPGKTRVEWTAQIINDIPNELIAWQTVGGADMVSAGSVHFAPEPDDRGTAMSVKLQYDLPGGKAAALFARVFGSEPAQVLREGLRRFKQLMEAGEIPTTSGQPRGGR